MRGQIIDRLFAKMKSDPSVFFLTADMGINLVEKFGEEYPGRFANVGIAEQNMIGIAAGLCNTGFMPFAYTISNFLVHRCFEQIRNDVVLHKYPVVLLGTSAGFDNAPLGSTHHIVDDWGVLNGLPEIDIYCPSTASYAETLVDKLIERRRPAYVRIAKDGADLPVDPEDIVYLPGKNAGTILVSYGASSAECRAVQEARDDVSLLVFNRIRPMDEDRIANILRGYKRALVVEDHFAHGGLYGCLCRLVCESGLSVKLESRAPACEFALEIGRSPQYFFEKFGMSASRLLADL